VLSDSDSDVRTSAAKALVRIGKPAVEALIRALGDPVVRKGAAITLRELGDKRAVEPLITALRSHSEGVRKGAAIALESWRWICSGSPYLCAKR
jgi:HEAT repeat protein